MDEGTVRAIVAVATRLEFYRDLQKKLDAWLKENPAMIAEYKAAMASIDAGRIKWEADLDALSDGIVPITPPSETEVNELKQKVQELSARIAAAKAVDDFLKLAAEASETL